MIDFYRMSIKLWLHAALQGRSSLYDRVVSGFEDVEEIWNHVRAQNGSVFPMLTEKMRQRLLLAADQEPERYLDLLDSAGAEVVFRGEDTYPLLLREIHDAPPVLYIKGRLEPEPALPIAVVGSRGCTEYGRTVANWFSRELAEAGALIVSGLADGIDSAAAMGALSAKGSQYPTVAVLGCGVDVVYPSSNRRLYGMIAERGCVISELPMGTKPSRESFPMRNRIISGMSRGIFVVEAAERSGTSITAGLALEQGRDVFALPGRITDPMSVGTNRMIAHGEAKPVFCVEDILSEYGASLTGQARGRQVILRTQLSKEENSIVDSLLISEKSFDELCEACGFTVWEMNSYLTGLEFLGIMKQLPGRIYALNTIEYELKDDRSQF